jgi:hypothetical protein
MPDGVTTFGEIESVWVTTPALAIPLAGALRLALSEASTARRASEGQQDKMAILYQYLTGPQFRQRVEAIKDAFITMQEDLDAEKRAINKQWAKRQQQIERVMISTVGMYGDSLLFLPGIRTIDVSDHVRGFRAVLTKTETCAKEDIDGGVSLRRLRTTCTHVSLTEPGNEQPLKSRDWWVGERIVGALVCGDEARATRERQAIRDAIRTLRLPEENWKDVEQVPVAIALPDPARRDDEEVTPLGAAGRFCIGLPVRRSTLAVMGQPHLGACPWGESASASGHASDLRRLRAPNQRCAPSGWGGSQ